MPLLVCVVYYKTHKDDVTGARSHILIVATKRLSCLRSGGSGLASAFAMSRLVPRAFAPADEDLSLQVSGLDEFFPTRMEPQEADPTLAIALQEIFPERSAEPIAITEPPVATTLDAWRESNDVDDWFGDASESHLPTTRDARRGANDFDDDFADAFADADAASTSIAADERPSRRRRACSPNSEIRRAAEDFQRFADEFHAFATECR